MVRGVGMEGVINRVLFSWDLDRDRAEHHLSAVVDPDSSGTLLLRLQPDPVAGAVRTWVIKDAVNRIPQLNEAIAWAAKA